MTSKLETMTTAEVLNERRQFREARPGHARVQKFMDAAIAAGELVRPANCSECREPSKHIDAHHDDYSKPLEVRWLCRKCHRTWHAANGEGKNLRV